MDNVILINIEPEQQLEINNYIIKPEIPLPILQEEVNGIVQDKELPWPAFVRGIIHVLAESPDFIHVDEYKAFLYAYSQDIEATLLAEGAHLASEGKLDTAIVIFKGLTNLNPELDEARFNLGLTYRDLAVKSIKNNPDQGHYFTNLAIDNLEVLNNKNSVSPLVYYNLGFLYRQKGMLSQAKEAWEKAVEFGLDADRSAELAKLIHELDRLDIVEAQFENDVNAINQGRFKDGITLLQPLAKRYPHWWQISFNLGLAYRNLEDYERAMLIFEKIAELNPAMPEVYSQIGLCLFALGQMEEAENSLRQALSLIPDDTGYLGNLGLVYLRQQRFEEAAEILYKALAITPEDALIQHYLKDLPKQFQR